MQSGKKSIRRGFSMNPAHRSDVENLILHFAAGRETMRLIAPGIRLVIFIQL